MTLIEQIDATKFLKPGWNGDKEHPSKVINDATRLLAKVLMRAIGERWQAGPWPDGSIVLTHDNKKIMVAAQ